MIDLSDYVYKSRPDSGNRKLYRHYCDECDVDRGYKRKHATNLCHTCANKLNYDRSQDKIDYPNVNFDDVIVKTYSDKNINHYRTRCISCDSDRGYLTKQSWNVKCRDCSTGYTENKVREIFESRFDKQFPTVRPKFLRNPETGRNLELDGYCEELKLAFEYDGRLHYESWDEDDPEPLAKTQERDKLKDKLCEENDIILIRIPYWEKTNLDSYIEGKLKGKNV